MQDSPRTRAFKIHGIMFEVAWHIDEDQDAVAFSQVSQVPANAAFNRVWHTTSFDAMLPLSMKLELNCHDISQGDRELYTRRKRQIRQLTVNLRDVASSGLYHRFAGAAAEFFQLPNLCSLNARADQKSMELLRYFCPSTLGNLHISLFPPHPYEDEILDHLDVLGSLPHLTDLTLDFVDKEGRVVEDLCFTVDELTTMPDILSLVRSPERLLRFGIGGRLTPLSLTDILPTFPGLTGIRLITSCTRDEETHIATCILPTLPNQTLQELDLVVQEAFPEAPLDIVSNFTSLTHLTLSLGGIRWPGLQALADIPGLEQIRLELPRLRANLDREGLQDAVRAWSRVQVLHLMTTVSWTDAGNAGDDEAPTALWLHDLELLGLHNCPELVDLKVVVRTDYVEEIPTPTARFCDSLAVDFTQTRLDGPTPSIVAPYLHKLWPTLGSFVPGFAMREQWWDLLEMYDPR